MKLVSHYIESSLIIIMLVLTSGFVYHQDKQHRIEAFQDTTQTSAKSLAYALENWFNNRHAVLTTLADQISTSDDSDPAKDASIRHAISITSELAPDIKKIFLMDRERNYDLLHPQKQSNHITVDNDYSHSPDGHMAAITSREEIVQENGMIRWRVPIRTPSADPALRSLVVYLSPESVITPYLERQKGKKQIVVRTEGEKTIYQYGKVSPLPNDNNWEISIPLRFGNKNYSLIYTPSSETVSATAYPVNMIILIVGTITTLGTAIVLNKELRLRIDQRERHQTQMQQLSALTIESRDQENHKLGRRLHDELGHALSLARMDIESLTSAPSIDPTKIDRAATQVGKAVDTVRSLSAALSLPGFFDLGFIPPLKHLVEEFQKTTGIQTQFEEKGADTDPPVQQQICIYRILQEALTNVMKHAKASHVDVTVQRQKNQVSCSIQDDGVGFRPHQQGEALRGIGLLGMNQRAEQAGGKLKVSSSPGQGTKIVCSFSTKAPKT